MKKTTNENLAMVTTTAAPMSHPVPPKAPAKPTFRRAQRATIRRFQGRYPQLGLRLCTSPEVGDHLEMRAPQVAGLDWRGHAVWIMVPGADGKVHENAVGDIWQDHGSLTAGLRSWASASALMHMLSPEPAPQAGRAELAAEVATATCP